MNNFEIRTVLYDVEWIRNVRAKGFKERIRSRGN